jgi:hypothetical protein
MSYQAQLAADRILSCPYDKKGGLFTFHIIPGNHDLYDTNPAAGHSLQVLELWRRPNVKIYLEPTDLEVGGLPLRFLPWPYQTFSSKRLNIAHVDVKGSRTDSGRLNDKEHMTDSKAWALIGHIHTKQKVRNSYYPGTLYQTNFGESADKFFAHVSYDDGWTIDMVPAKPTYRLHTVLVETKADLKDVPVGPNDLIKLVIKGQVSASAYKHLNVVKTVVAKSEAEVALALVEELSARGEKVEISTDEFFRAWLDNQSKDKALTKRTWDLRQRLLKKEVA